MTAVEAAERTLTVEIAGVPVTVTLDVEQLRPAATANDRLGRRVEVRDALAALHRRLHAGFLELLDLDEAATPAQPELVAEGSPVEVLRDFGDARVVRHADGSIVALGTVRALDGTPVTSGITLHRPERKLTLTGEELRLAEYQEAVGRIIGPKTAARCRPLTRAEEERAEQLARYGPHPAPAAPPEPPVVVKTVPATPPARTTPSVHDSPVYAEELHQRALEKAVAAADAWERLQ